MNKNDNDEPKEKQMKFSSRLAVIGCALLAMVAISTTASAQGTLFVENDRVSIGITPPSFPLDVFATPTTVGTGNAVIRLARSGALAFQLDDTSVNGFWNFSSASGESEFRISRSGTGFTEMTLTSDGNLFIRGACSEGGNPGTGSCADYVFEPDYELKSLDELSEFIKTNKHLPNVPSTEEIKKNGLNVQGFQGRLLEKIEELTLYTLQQEETIRALNQRLAAIEAKG